MYTIIKELIVSNEEKNTSRNNDKLITFRDKLEVGEDRFVNFSTSERGNSYQIKGFCRRVICHLINMYANHGVIVESSEREKGYMHSFENVRRRSAFVDKTSSVASRARRVAIILIFSKINNLP